MKHLKKAALFAVFAMIAVAAFAFAQAKGKIEAAAPTVGSPAPSYALPDQDGQEHTRAADKGKVTLLAFYPADFTGGCTLEAHSLSSAYSELKAEGVSVYGVSVQDPKSHKSFCSKEGIPYTLLADTEKKMSGAYGVLIPGIGIANRVTFIIGTDGKIAFIDKDVNGHLTTCGADWAAWVKAHRDVVGYPHVRGSDIQESFANEGGVFIPASFTLLTAGPAIIGKPAPDFTLRDAVTDKSISLGPLVGSKKAVVVMFLSTRCPVSNAYNDRMAALAKKYGAQDISFVGIDANKTEPVAEIASFAREKGFPFPVLKDVDDQVADAYKAHVTPETYVISSRGILVYHGRIDNDIDPAAAKTHELADALDAVLAGKAVSKTEAKAFGCSIKR